jgi:hypothetical protein
MSGELVGLKLTNCLGIPLVQDGAMLVGYIINVKSGELVYVTAQYQLGGTNDLKSRMFKVELVSEEEITLD